MFRTHKNDGGYSMNTVRSVRFISFLIALLMVVLLPACGGNKDLGPTLDVNITHDADLSAGVVEVVYDEEALDFSGVSAADSDTIVASTGAGTGKVTVVFADIQDGVIPANVSILNLHFNQTDGAAAAPSASLKEALETDRAPIEVTTQSVGLNVDFSALSSAQVESLASSGLGDTNLSGDFGFSDLGDLNMASVKDLSSEAQFRADFDGNGTFTSQDAENALKRYLGYVKGESGIDALLTIIPKSQSGDAADGPFHVVALNAGGDPMDKPTTTEPDVKIVDGKGKSGQGYLFELTPSSNESYGVEFDAGSAGKNTAIVKLSGGPGPDPTGPSLVCNSKDDNINIMAGPALEIDNNGRIVQPVYIRTFPPFDEQREIRNVQGVRQLKQLTGGGTIADICYFRGEVKLEAKAPSDTTKVEFYVETTFAGDALHLLADISKGDPGYDSSTGVFSVMYDSRNKPVVNGEAIDHEGKISHITVRIHKQNTITEVLSFPYIPDNKGPQAPDPEVLAADAQSNHIQANCGVPVENWSRGSVAHFIDNKSLSDLPFDSDDHDLKPSGLERISYYWVPAPNGLGRDDGIPPAGGSGTQEERIQAIRDAAMLSGGIERIAESAGPDLNYRKDVDSKGVNFNGNNLPPVGRYHVYAISTDQLGNETPSTLFYPLGIDNEPPQLSGSIVDTSRLPFAARKNYLSDYVRIRAQTQDAGVGFLSSAPGSIGFGNFNFAIPLPACGEKLLTYDTDDIFHALWAGRDADGNLQGKVPALYRNYYGVNTNVFTSDGEYPLVLTSEDALGNKSTKGSNPDDNDYKNYLYIVDNTDPTIDQAIAPGSSNYRSGETIPIQAGFKDTTSGLYMTTFFWNDWINSFNSNLLGANGLPFFPSGTDFIEFAPNIFRTPSPSVYQINSPVEIDRRYHNSQQSVEHATDFPAFYPYPAPFDDLNLDIEALAIDCAGNATVSNRLMTVEPHFDQQAPGLNSRFIPEAHRFDVFDIVSPLAPDHTNAGLSARPLRDRLNLGGPSVFGVPLVWEWADSGIGLTLVERDLDPDAVIAIELGVSDTVSNNTGALIDVVAGYREARFGAWDLVKDWQLNTDPSLWEPRFVTGAPISGLLSKLPVAEIIQRRQEWATLDPSGDPDGNVPHPNSLANYRNDVDGPAADAIFGVPSGYGSPGDPNANDGTPTERHVVHGVGIGTTPQSVAWVLPPVTGTRNNPGAIFFEDPSEDAPLFLYADTNTSSGHHRVQTVLNGGPRNLGFGESNIYMIFSDEFGWYNFTFEQVYNAFPPPYHPSGGVGDASFWTWDPFPPSNQDSDNDGVPDAVEIPLGGDPNDSNTDDDNLSDLKEFELNSKLNDPDQDDDGVCDGPGLAVIPGVCNRGPNPPGDAFPFDPNKD